MGMQAAVWAVAHGGLTLHGAAILRGEATFPGNTVPFINAAPPVVGSRPFPYRHHCRKITLQLISIPFIDSSLLFYYFIQMPELASDCRRCQVAYPIAASQLLVLIPGRRRPGTACPVKCLLRAVPVRIRRRWSLPSANIRKRGLSS